MEGTKWKRWKKQKSVKEKEGKRIGKNKFGMSKDKGGIEGCCARKTGIANCKAEKTKEERQG